MATLTGVEAATGENGRVPAYEFGSESWAAAVHGAWAACVAIAALEQPDLTFSMSETVTNPPEHLGRAGAASGWSCVVEDGRLVGFRAGGDAAAAYRVTAAYELLRDLCRFEVAGDPERARVYAALTQMHWDTGAIRTEGQPPKLPRPFRVLHDVFARLTR